MYLHSLIFIFSSMSSKNRLLFMYKKKPHDPVLINLKYIIFIDEQQKKIFHEHVCFYFVSSFDESNCWKENSFVDMYRKRTRFAF